MRGISAVFVPMLLVGKFDLVRDYECAQKAAEPNNDSGKGTERLCVYKATVCTGVRALCVFMLDVCTLLYVCVHPIRASSDGETGGVYI